MSRKISPNYAAEAQPSVAHPGQYVREEILLPRSMTVTDAAKLIGISRPGVSNFLNAKVAATPDMAARIERAFGIPAQTLLDKQTAYDAAQAKAKGVQAKVKTYVPPFLATKASDIEAWVSGNLSSRHRLSVLLRTIVNSTGVGLTKVDFPGNDDAERPGWDGYIEATEGTPWVPEGRSGWEFGVNVDIRGKADGDFKKSIKGVEKSLRDQTTFIFVTPRRWAGKTAWVADANAKRQWKDVRAYDASDLEQWFEQSLAAQTWFANETRRPSQGIRTLDKCWADWADVAAPPLTGALFSSAIDASKRVMLSQLSTGPGSSTVIAADSVEEALAFLSQLLSDAGGPDLAYYRDRVLVFDKPGVLPRLAQGTPNFIPVAFTRDVERELATSAQSMHAIVVYPRNSTSSESHITLEPVGYENFRTALEIMKYDRDAINRYDQESGRSLTVLRRRLSKNNAIRTPEWAADHQTARSLIPLMFVGTWSDTNEADQIALSLLAESSSYETLEKDCQRLSQLNDAPVWSIGHYRGVLSKIDLLYAIASTVTAADLKRYFQLARMVLGEDDPSLDLPEVERWAASYHGKSREYSAAFRQGISETLVLLAIHGNNLFKKRIGVDCETEVAQVVNYLLRSPLTTRMLEANDHDLPTYAEAAPNTFLSIIERDLREEHPAVLGLLKPSDTGVFGRSPSRTGLLWALEGLAWKPETLLRSARILARLAQVEINDNWVNKPSHSLQSIFRVWMPQTAAGAAVRLDVLKKLALDFPDVAWKICVAQFDGDQGVGDYSHKPRWRPDGYGFGEPIPTWGPIIAFRDEMIAMAIAWNGHTRSMICDLIARLHELDENSEARVWNLVETFARHGTDEDKAELREKIRVTVMSRRGVMLSKRGSKSPAGLNAAAKAAYAALEPSNLINKHAWLFRDGWVDESADEIEDEGFDVEKREQRITKLRINAIGEVLAARGIEGIFELADRGKAAWQMGVLLAGLLPEAELATFAIAAIKRLSHKEDNFSIKNLIGGFLRWFTDEAKAVVILKSAAKELSSDEMVSLLLLSPFRRSSWEMVDQLDEVRRAAYWKDIAPHYFHPADGDSSEAVERLLAARRPRAAFSFVHLDIAAMDPELLFRLLTAMAQDGDDQAGHYRLEQYSLEQAFQRLNTSTTLTLEQKAGLEFTYVEVLAPYLRTREGYGIPNLEKYVEQHPELFIQAIVWAYKRSDGGEDPSEWKVATDDARNLAKRGHKLLDGLRQMPGHNDLGELEAVRLAKWVSTVREKCSELGRSEIADICLGKLFSHASTDPDGVWPCEPVRQVMEELQSEKVSQGARTGLYNQRGVVWRGEGGGQERELAQKYLRWAEALQYSHPFVSSNLLMDMVKTYELEASRHDTEAGIKRRMR
jgi:addiction module HigA family antidote